ncbi:MAG: hypothetical protein ABIJ34_03390 [archaeon]
MGDSVITYENIFELLRNEKNAEQLQQLSPELYSQIVNYLKTKLQAYEDAKRNKNVPSEIDRIKTQIISARKLIKELYERRERKIVLLAIDRSRTGKPLPDESALLEEEKNLIKALIEPLDVCRKGILLKLVNAKLPFSEGIVPLVIEKPIEEEAVDKIEYTTVRFTSDVPKFVGKELEFYGPFKPGDIARLDSEIAQVLISRERAEIIKISNYL